MGTIRFNLRIDKKNNQGLCPIELIYQVEGQRKYYGTGSIIHPAYWFQNVQAAFYKDPKVVKKEFPAIDKAQLWTAKQVENFNNDLYKFKDIIGEIEQRFELDRIPYTCSMVVNQLKVLKGKKTAKEVRSNLLFDFMDEYITANESTRAKGSLSVYKALKSHLEAYQRHTGKKITFDLIDFQFFEMFQSFLISHRKLNNTTVAKQLSTVKTFLNYARVRGIEVGTNYKDFKIKRESLEVIALTNDEFEKLYHLDLSGNKRLQQVRDVFCFACSTGLRYSDLEQLKREHIKEDEIRLTVKKTKEQLSIPLTPYSTAILNKYKDQARPLPVISNQKLNQYLKGWDEDVKGKVKHNPGLCELAGINEQIEIVRYRGAKREAIVYPKYELIGVHTGRKTFATLSLEKGMSAEEVMSITGHRDYQSFKRYVKVTEQRKKVVMLAAWKNPKQKSKLKAI
jgi:integrase